MIIILAIMVVIVIGSFIAIKARAAHKKKQSLKRPCAKCGAPTIRRAQMVPVTVGADRRWSRRYHSYIFNDCSSDECRHVELVRDPEKWFRLDKIAVRHIGDPRQFTIDEDLFQRAGLIDIPQLSLEERVTSFRVHMDGAETAQHRRALGIKLRCNS